MVQAGNQVGWAFRGFNPHRKKNKSFYPLFAHLAQTGQILKSRNRPGNVHDSKGADAFLRELIGELRGQFGRSRKLEFRMDAAFFNEKILKRLERSRSEFAIKAPFWPWLGLKEVVAGRKRWHRVSDEIDGFSIKYFIEPWNITVRIAIYRKRVRHRTAKNFRLDLFSPDDGYFEYSAVATNKSLTVQRLWYFAAGRGGQEKTFAELRSQFALDVVPTNPNRKIFEARKRETAALGAGEKLVLGHPLTATIGDSARCMQNLEKVLFTGPKTSDTVTFICD